MSVCGSVCRELCHRLIHEGNEGLMLLLLLPIIICGAIAQVMKPKKEDEFERIMKWLK